jgi:hypothetical protein
MGLQCKHFNKIKKKFKKNFQNCQRRPWPVQAGPKKFKKKFKKNRFFSFKVALIDPGPEKKKKKIDFFFKVASADPVRHRTRLQSCSHRPCALTHRVYEGNFASFYF